MRNGTSVEGTRATAPVSAERFTPPPPARPVTRKLTRRDAALQRSGPAGDVAGSAPVAIGLAVVGIGVAGVVAPGAHASGVVPSDLTPRVDSHQSTGSMLRVSESREMVSELPATSGRGEPRSPSPFWTEDIDPGAGEAAHIPDQKLLPPVQTGAGPAAAAQPPTPRIVESTVTVRAGESLWSITRDLLGPSADAAAVGQAWPQLWAANGDRVTDPDLIQPGTVLTVPESVSNQAS